MVSKKKKSTISVTKTKSAKDALINDISASFQETACDMIVENTIKCAISKKVHTVVVGGGVSANMRFRDKLHEAARKCGLNIHFPPMKLCLDNGAMTAGLGEALYKKGHRSNLTLTAIPDLLI